MGSRNLKSYLYLFFVLGIAFSVWSLSSLDGTTSLVKSSDFEGLMNFQHGKTFFSTQEEQIETKTAESVDLNEKLRSYWRYDNPKVSRGYSLRFDGEDDYINASSPEIRFYSYNFTLSAWVKPESIDGEFHDNVSGVFLGQDYGSSVALGISEEGSVFMNMDDTRADTPESSKELEEGEWYHVSVTYTHPNKQATYYVDGEPFNSEQIYDGNGIQNSNELWIGRSQRYSMYFDGRIDEVRVYNRSLSSDGVSNLYRGGTPARENLILSYSFESGSSCDLSSTTPCLFDGSVSQNPGLPVNFDDNNFGTESGWKNETPVNALHLRDYSAKNDDGLIQGVSAGKLDEGDVDGLKGSRNLLENPGFEDTSLGTGVNVNVSGWDMSHQDLYLNGSSIMDLQSSKATAGSYGYGEETCCDPYDDGSGTSGTGSGYIAQRENVEGNQEIRASIKANILTRDLSNVTTCPGSDVYVGEDDSRLRFVAYNSTDHQIGSKWGNWGTWFVYQAENTTGDYHGWTELRLNWTTPPDTEEVDMRVYYGDATDSCRSWTWWNGGNGAVFWDEAKLAKDKSLKWIKGKVGDHSLKFDAEDDKIQGISNEKLAKAYNKDKEITINLWFRIDRIYTDTRWNDIIQFGDTTNGTDIGTDGVRLERLSDSNNTLAFYTYNSGGNHQWNLGSPGPYTVGNWHMATLVMDYSGDGESRAYLDGQLSDTKSKVDVWNITPNSMEIFSQGDWSDFSLDDVRIYNRDLSKSEIESLYNGKDLRNGLINQWNFESGDRSEAYQTSGLETEGILGTPAVNNLEGGKVGGLSTNSRSFTFSSWIKPEDSGYSALLSERKQNQVKHSETFSNSVWNSYCNPGTWDHNTTEVKAPDGTYTASKFQTLDTGSGCDIIVGKLQNLYTEKRVYTASIWAKSKKTGNSLKFGTTDGEDCRYSLTDEWRRYTCQRDVSDTSRGIQFYGIDANSTYYVWGVQRQFGAGAGNYIETMDEKIQEPGISSWLNNGKLYLKSGNSTEASTDSLLISSRRWHRIAVSRKEDGGTKIFLDDRSESHPTAPIIRRISSLILGGHEKKTGFRGKLDETRLYNTSLSKRNIGKLMFR